ncbi:hypothetical protein AGLY_015820 [Aphis glycines]|uniref:Uncharacterized protein n=1 Tax=Aphis glycines TaxID=307491 RepID=A0A6G0SZD6_APHGL|nr:hypothetical protein AGLY_015820 [Aphis glycines]
MDNNVYINKYKILQVVSCKTLVNAMYGGGRWWCVVCTAKNTKGGAEKARLKRAALLKQAANHPKQMKLDFSLILSVNKTETISVVVFFVINNFGKSLNLSNLLSQVEDSITYSNTNTNSIIDDETEFNIKFPSYPKNLTLVQKLEFVNTVHPCQPNLLENVAWSLHRIYNRTDLKGNLIPRKWLTVQCKQRQ